jgi:hypothetical protein
MKNNSLTHQPHADYYKYLVGISNKYSWLQYSALVLLGITAFILLLDVTAGPLLCLIAGSHFHVDLRAVIIVAYFCNVYIHAYLLIVDSFSTFLDPLEQHRFEALKNAETILQGTYGMKPYITGIEKEIEKRKYYLFGYFYHEKLSPVLNIMILRNPLIAPFYSFGAAIVYLFKHKLLNEKLTSFKLLFNEK